MKTLTRHRLARVALGIVCTQLVLTSQSCRPEDPLGTSAECRLVGRTTTITYPAPAQSYSRQTTWLYNDRNALVQYANPGAIGGNSPTRVDYKYNPDGFLTGTVQAYVYSGFAGLIYDTLRTSYEYVNGKLSREIIGGNLYRALGSTGTIAYAYNASGELTQIVDRSDSWGDVKTSTYQADRLTDYVLIRSGSTAEQRPYVLTDGLIRREHGTDRRYYTNFDYDAQRRPTKYERFDGELGRVTEYHTFSYTTGKAHQEAIPLPKGWPVLARSRFVYDEAVFGTPVVADGLSLSQIRFKPTKVGSTELFRNMVTEYTHITNRQEYPTRSEYSTTAYTWSGGAVNTPARITETFTYEGCR